MNTRHKIIFDTDPGIDDAMAILFAEAHPDIELMGLTTVYGNAPIETTTKNALFLKQKFGMDATIAKGADKPLVRSPLPPSSVVHAENGLGNYPVPENVEGEIDARPAWQYIVDTVRAHPGEITLVAVGPLTNLALALEAAPDIATLVEEVVIMGGAFGENGHHGNVTPFAEANIHDDPHAADKVLTAGWPVVIIGLDATHECFFSRQYIEELGREGGEMGKFIDDISKYYLDFYSARHGLDGCFVHDPSPVAYVIEPSLFTLRSGPVRVVTEGVAEGMTLQKTCERRYPYDDWKDIPEQDVAVNVREDELLALYRNTFITD